MVKAKYSLTWLLFPKFTLMVTRRIVLLHHLIKVENIDTRFDRRGRCGAVVSVSGCLALCVCVWESKRVCMPTAKEVGGADWLRLFSSLYSVDPPWNCPAPRLAIPWSWQQHTGRTNSGDVTKLVSDARSVSLFYFFVSLRGQLLSLKLVFLFVSRDPEV